jgi:phosphonate transport system ATP-binding protein
MVMDALQSINKDLGITVLCNLHALDVARNYCDRLVGMSDGRVVFDGAPEALSQDLVKSLYGIEADEMLLSSPESGRNPTNVLPFERVVHTA